MKNCIHWILKVNRSSSLKTVIRTLYSFPENDESYSNKFGRDPTKLQHRFIKFLEDTLKLNTSPTSEKNNKEPVKNLRSANWENSAYRPTILEPVFEQINEFRYWNNRIKYKPYFDHLDQDCCDLVNALSAIEILLLLNKLAEMFPSRLQRFNFYDQSMSILQNIFNSSTEPHKIINLLFLLSWQRKRTAINMQNLVNNLQKIDELSLTAQAILCVATFKAGVRLTNDKLQAVENSINRNWDILIKDKGLLICLIKALRLAGPSRNFSFEFLNKKILDSEEEYNLYFATPIMALYASTFTHEQEVLDRLIGDSVSDIKKDIVSQKQTGVINVRNKDISRLLWTAGRLNYKFTEQQFDVIEGIIDDRWDEMIKEHSFISLLLSLWILNSKNIHKKIKYCIRENIFFCLNVMSEKKRLELLLRCVKIEAPEIKLPSQLMLSQRIIPNKKSKKLSSMYELLMSLVSYSEMNETKIEYPISELRICGISTKHKTLGWIHVDMLNNDTCFRGSRKPHGLMSLKLRLIKKLGFHSILLNEERDSNLELKINFIREKIDSLVKESTFKI
ncbi:uncharacterized protein LOC105689575 [Athalia rosae]|uniref:uncharacterized protein LOC105689575 n=1 Tax=Athalia rosae TaxID=37344 RepID=UPI00203379C8|nr:uncharacterized protein LOC105689575 [Athalia rosae]XP_012262125.2 uncharacterized protein LOC105689575 [Athalia rosae]XP_048515072.1 uncharacterized protein LOC105689575 [Athalia rosae]